MKGRVEVKGRGGEGSVEERMEVPGGERRARVEGVEAREVEGVEAWWEGRQGVQ